MRRSYRIRVNEENIKEITKKTLGKQNILARSDELVSKCCIMAFEYLRSYPDSSFTRVFDTMSKSFKKFKLPDDYRVYERITHDGLCKIIKVENKRTGKVIFEQQLY